MDAGFHGLFRAEVANHEERGFCLAIMAEEGIYPVSEPGGLHVRPVQSVKIAFGKRWMLQKGEQVRGETAELLFFRRQQGAVIPSPVSPMEEVWKIT